MERLKSRLAAVFELSAGNRIPAMEGLRGVAATLVFFTHYQSLFGMWTHGSRFAEFLGCVGHAGVDLFFVLSGYLIYGMVLRSRAFAYGDFMRRRFRRIYPTFAVMLAVYVALGVVAPVDARLSADAVHKLVAIAENALLLPGVFAITPIMTVAWSLSYEVFFYAVVPLLVALGMRAWSARSRIATVLAIAAAFAAFSFFGGGRVKFLTFASGMLVYDLIGRLRGEDDARVDGIAVALALAALPVAWLLSESHGVLETTGAAVFGANEINLGYLGQTLWLSVAFGVIAVAAFRGKGAVAKVCSFTPLRWLGNMSYSYYLVHGFALKVLAVVAQKVVPGSLKTPFAYWASMPLFYAGTIAASAIVFVAIEKRFSLGQATSRDQAEGRTRNAPSSPLLGHLAVRRTHLAGSNGSRVRARSRSIG